MADVRISGEMTKIRAKFSAAVVAAIVTIGLTMMAAVPADAQSRIPNGGIPNGTDLECGSINNGSHYLDDYGGGSGTYVHTYPYTGSNNQTWCIEFVLNANATFSYYIHPFNNVNGLCLDAHTDNNYQPIWVFSCNGSGPQLWNWDWPVGGYLVRATNSQRALHDNGLYNIVTIDGPGNNNNKWAFSNTFDCVWVDNSCA
jgi:hypothetical protein